MCHSLAHHAAHRRPGDVHLNFFGTATLSFADGFKALPGDVFEVDLPGLGAPLGNPLARESAPGKNNSFERRESEGSMLSIKNLALVLALGAAVLVAACNRGAPKSAGTESGETRAVVLGFSQIGAESEWRTANSRSIQSAAQDAGVDLRFSDAQQKQENQIKALRSFIAQRVDVIAFSPVVETGWETVLREAKAANIPVVLTDRAVEVNDDSLYLTLIGSDFVEEGRRAGRWLLEYFSNGPGKDTKGDVNIVELQGTVGSAPANDRKKGFAEIIATQPRFKIIRSQTGDFTRAKGKEVMEAFLKAEGNRAEGKKISVLFAHNDDMAIGAIQAIEEAGLKPGTDIIIISIDGVKGAFEAMIAGKLNVSVECSPLLGPQLMAAVKDVAAGKTIPRRIVTEEGVFPKETAAEEFPKRKY